jgi:hypothetical protein
MSLSASSKSNSWALEWMRSLRLDLGMTMAWCWIAQRSMTRAGVRARRSATVPESESVAAPKSRASRQNLRIPSHQTVKVISTAAVALCWKCDRSWRRNFGSCCKPPPFSLSIPSFGTPQAGSDKRAGSPARGDTRQTPDARAGSAGLSRGRVTHQTRAAPRRLPSPRFWAQPFPSY